MHVNLNVKLTCSLTKKENREKQPEGYIQTREVKLNQRENEL